MTNWWGRYPDGSQTDGRGGVVTDGSLRRGIDTSLGQAGMCEACGVTMPDGPDACLGVLPGVSHACCGHGGAAEAYVVIGGEPDQPCQDDWTTLRGADATAYFEAVR